MVSGKNPKAVSQIDYALSYNDKSSFIVEDEAIVKTAEEKTVLWAFFALRPYC